MIRWQYVAIGVFLLGASGFALREWVGGTTRSMPVGVVRSRGVDMPVDIRAWWVARGFELAEPVVILAFVGTVGRIWWLMRRRE